MFLILWIFIFFFGLKKRQLVLSLILGFTYIELAYNVGLLGYSLQSKDSYKTGGLNVLSSFCSSSPTASLWSWPWCTPLSSPLRPMWLWTSSWLPCLVPSLRNTDKLQTEAGADDGQQHGRWYPVSLKMNKMSDAMKLCGGVHFYRAGAD